MHGEGETGTNVLFCLPESGIAAAAAAEEGRRRDQG